MSHEYENRLPRAALLLGPSFGLVWGAVMWLLNWRAQDFPLGVAMAAYYRWSGRQTGFSHWADL